MVCDVSSFLLEALPTIAPEVRDYISGNLIFITHSHDITLIHGWHSELLTENASELTSPSEVFEAVGDHIQASANDVSEDETNELCQKIFSILHEGYLNV
jgi:hypothetical protein